MTKLKMVKNKAGKMVPFYAADGKGKMMYGGTKRMMYGGTKRMMGGSLNKFMCGGSYKGDNVISGKSLRK